MKVIITILTILLLLLQYKLWLGDGGVPNVLQLQTELQRQTELRDELKERNRSLDAEVSDIKKGLDAIEERARSELGMIGKGETFFQVIPPSTH